MILNTKWIYLYKLNKTECKSVKTIFLFTTHTRIFTLINILKIVEIIF